MKQSSQTVVFPLAAPSLALLVLIFLLAACTTGPGSSNQATPAAANTSAPATAVEIKTAPTREPSGTAAPDAAGQFDCAGVSQIPVAECAALVALYESTNGPHWVDNSGWLASDVPCTWSGIDCTLGHVSHIHLLYNELAGTLPPELGDLSHLQVLGLWVNQLHGPIPAELGNLSGLVSLDLSANQLAGPLPAELGSLRNLRRLFLAHNQISGPIPATLGDLESLDLLNLSHNHLSGSIPPELGDLASLTQLYLSHNQLSGAIPVTLGRASKFVELDLSYNQLRGSIPEAVTRIDQRMLWGNQLEGTITTSGPGPFTVDYEDVHFSADPSLASSIWPEVIPTTAIIEDEPFTFFDAAPEHVRFTFADPRSSPRRLRMGISLAAEAQILVYPLAELAAIDPRIQAQVERLQGLLAERGPVPAGDLPLFPFTNAAQVFHAQAQYLVSGDIQGLRFLSQHAQDVHPVSSQELFYTFQGITADAATYVAAFFPVATAALPERPESVAAEEWEVFSANFDAYLLETTDALDQLTPADFAPDLTLLDAVVTSLRVGPEGASTGQDTVLSPLPLIAPPVGLVYGAGDGLWRLGADGEPHLLTERANALPAPDAAHAVYMDDQRRLWLIDLADGEERQLAAGVDVSSLFQWGVEGRQESPGTLLLGVWIMPAESEGAATGHMATLDIDTGELRVIDRKYLSLGRPALAPDGETVAYDISPYYADVALNGRLYHPDSGSGPLDPALFAGSEVELPWRLYNPAWSPDGRQLAWLWAAESGTRLAVFDLTRKTVTTALAWQPAQFGALPPSPVWSLDGKWLAIEIWANNEAESGLWLVAADGGDAQRVSPTSRSSAFGGAPVWLTSHELAYVECDENFNNCENRLFDLVSGTTGLLDLPEGSIVLLAPA